MASSATFCSIPLSTSVDPLSQRSLVSLEWILTSGIPAHQSVASGVLTLPSGNTMCSMHMKLSVSPGLAHDLVLGRDWLFFCRETLPHASFHLSSGIVHPGWQSCGALPLKFTPSSILTRFAAANSAMDVDAQFGTVENSVDTPMPSRFIYYWSPYPVLRISRSGT